MAAKRSALFVWGGWPGHDPESTSRVFAGELRQAGFEVEVADTLDAFRDAAKLASLDLIVPVWTMGTIEPDQLRPILAAVKGGTGIAGWHGGMSDAFREAVEYQFMIGGQWVSHPGRDQVRYRVRMGPAKHPITDGLTDFFITSEQYYMHVDPNIEVIATSHVDVARASGDTVADLNVGLRSMGAPPPGGTSRTAHDVDFDQSLQDRLDRDEDVPHVVMPLAWTKRYGMGRVFHCTLGHQVAIFDDPQARLMVKRGLIWAARPSPVV